MPYFGLKHNHGSVSSIPARSPLAYSLGDELGSRVMAAEAILVLMVWALVVKLLLELSRNDFLQGFGNDTTKGYGSVLGRV